MTDTTLALYCLTSAFLGSAVTALVFSVAWLRESRRRAEKLRTILGMNK